MLTPAMRRPFALVCVATLVLAVLLVPVVAPAGVVCEPAAPGLLAAPTRWSGAGTDVTPLSPPAETVALLLFRGPPVAGFPLEQRTENPTREVSRCDGGDGARRS